MKHFTKQSSSLCSMHGKIEYCLHIKEKNYKFSSKNPSATKQSPPSNVYYMEFYRIFLFENS